MKSVSFILLAFSILGFATHNCLSQGVDTNAERNPISVAAAEYAAGKYDAIVQRLKKSEDVEDLYYLGLAYEKLRNPSEAADAFRKSFLKAYEVTEGKIKDSLKKNSGRDLWERLAEIERNSAIGCAAAQKAYGMKPTLFKENEFRLKASILKDANELPRFESEIEISSSKATSARITYRPKLISPLMSRKSEMPMRPFTVKLAVVFGSDGEIRLAFPIDDTVDAYTFSAISNVKGMRFEPAKLNDATVAYLRHMEFTFSWY